MAATAAVVLAREARPEHLVLISLTIGAAGFAGAGSVSDARAARRQGRGAAGTGALSESMRAVLEREKMLVLRSIKELEFDRAMGKVSEKDFEEMAGRLRARAMSLMRQLDADGGYRELIERELKARLSNPLARASARRSGSKTRGPSEPRGRLKILEVPPASDPGSCACGTTNDPDAAFCKRCGAKLAPEAGA